MTETEELLKVTQDFLNKYLNVFVSKSLDRFYDKEAIVFRDYPETEKCSYGTFTEMKSLIVPENVHEVSVARAATIQLPAQPEKFTISIQGFFTQANGNKISYMQVIDFNRQNKFYSITKDSLSLLDPMIHSVKPIISKTFGSKKQEAQPKEEKESKAKHQKEEKTTKPSNPPQKQQKKAPNFTPYHPN